MDTDDGRCLTSAYKRSCASDALDLARKEKLGAVYRWHELSIIMRIHS